MIYFDTTKTGAASHRSGLTRVSTRLASELGSSATSIRWPEWNRHVTAADWFFTSELFSEEERPGLSEFLEAKRCRTAAVFHDAIPLRFPHITWPKSVARHPAYMKLLAKFDRVFAVSAASKKELEGFWRWLGLADLPPVQVLPLGADFNGKPRVVHRERVQEGVPLLLCVGIIEPRKNQTFLLKVCEVLWSEGLEFELHFVGRVNPHFGKPIVAEIKRVGRTRRGSVYWHESANDVKLAQLYASAWATCFPTIAEGCGLPLIESLWLGVPCVCTDLPVLRENADGGGCIAVPPDNLSAWVSALRRIVTDSTAMAELQRAAAGRALPTWSAAADILRAALK